MYASYELIAKTKQNQVRDYIAEKLGGVGPRFVGILANTDPAARKYAEWTGRACIKDGIRWEVWFNKCRRLLL